MSGFGKADKVPLQLKKWTLKLKINFIRDYLGERGFTVTHNQYMIEWVGINHAEAGNVSVKFLQEMGELDFDKKIIQYFTLITDTPSEKETATQREKNLRDDLFYYAKKSTTAASTKKQAKKAPAKKANSKK